MANYDVELNTHTKKCFVLFFWHPMLVRPAMKRLFCMKEKMASVASLPRPCLIITVFFCESLHCYVVLVFILNHSFYVPTTSAVPPVSSLIFHPRKIEVLWSQTVREKNRTLKNQGRQIKCERTGYESTTQKRHPRN